jgi:hypothetical protein
MPGIDFTNLIDPDYPIVDRSMVTPTQEEVALLERTRTIDEAGAEHTTFTDKTRPTKDEADSLIKQALEITLSELPDYLPESVYLRIQQAVALRAAVLVEISFYREQYDRGSAKSYEAMYFRLIDSIQEQGGLGVGSRVDTPIMRSSMSEYQPDYPAPPPRVLPKTPFPIDQPTDEGQ